MKFFNKKTITFLVVLIAIFVVGVYVFETSIHQATIEKNKERPSCQSIKNPDGSDFNWNAISSDKVMKACLLQLAKNLQTPKHMADWLESQGFSKVNLYSTTWDSRVYLNATWDTEQFGKRIAFADNLSFFTRLITSDKNYTVQIIYEGGIPIGTSANHTIL